MGQNNFANDFYESFIVPYVLLPLIGYVVLPALQYIVLPIVQYLIAPPIDYIISPVFTAVYDYILSPIFAIAQYVVDLLKYPFVKSKKSLDVNKDAGKESLTIEFDSYSPTVNKERKSRISSQKTTTFESKTTTVVPPKEVVVEGPAAAKTVEADKPITPQAQSNDSSQALEEFPEPRARLDVAVMNSKVALNKKRTDKIKPPSRKKTAPDAQEDVENGIDSNQNSASKSTVLEPVVTGSTATELKIFSDNREVKSDGTRSLLAGSLPQNAILNRSTEALPALDPNTGTVFFPNEDHYSAECDNALEHADDRVSTDDAGSQWKAQYVLVISQLQTRFKEKEQLLKAIEALSTRNQQIISNRVNFRERLSDLASRIKQKFASVDAAAYQKKLDEIRNEIKASLPQADSASQPNDTDVVNPAKSAPANDLVIDRLNYASTGSETSDAEQELKASLKLSKPNAPPTVVSAADMPGSSAVTTIGSSATNQEPKQTLQDLKEIDELTNGPEVSRGAERADALTQNGDSNSGENKELSVNHASAPQDKAETIGEVISGLRNGGIVRDIRARHSQASDEFSDEEVNSLQSSTGTDFSPDDFTQLIGGYAWDNNDSTLNLFGSSESLSSDLWSEEQPHGQYSCRTGEMTGNVTPPIARSKIVKMAQGQQSEFWRATTESVNTGDRNSYPLATDPTTKIDSASGGRKSNIPASNGQTKARSSSSKSRKSPVLDSGSKIPRLATRVSSLSSLHVDASSVSADTETNNASSKNGGKGNKSIKNTSQSTTPQSAAKPPTRPVGNRSYMRPTQSSAAKSQDGIDARLANAGSSSSLNDAAGSAFRGNGRVNSTSYQNDGPSKKKKRFPTAPDSRALTRASVKPKTPHQKEMLGGEITVPKRISYQPAMSATKSSSDSLQQAGDIRSYVQAVNFTDNAANSNTATSNLRKAADNLHQTAKAEMQKAKNYQVTGVKGPSTSVSGATATQQKFAQCKQTLAEADQKIRNAHQEPPSTSLLRALSTQSVGSIVDAAVGEASDTAKEELQPRNADSYCQAARNDDSSDTNKQSLQAVANDFTQKSFGTNTAYNRDSTISQRSASSTHVVRNTHGAQEKVILPNGSAPNGELSISSPSTGMQSVTTVASLESDSLTGESQSECYNLSDDQFRQRQATFQANLQKKYLNVYALSLVDPEGLMPSGNKTVDGGSEKTNSVVWVDQSQQQVSCVKRTPSTASHTNRTSQCINDAIDGVPIDNAQSVEESGKKDNRRSYVQALDPIAEINSAQVEGSDASNATRPFSTYKSLQKGNKRWSDHYAEESKNKSIQLARERPNASFAHAV